MEYLTQANNKYFIKTRLSFFSGLVTVLILSVMSLLLTVSGIAYGQGSNLQNHADSLWQKEIEEAHKLKEHTYRHFKRDMDAAVAKKDKAVSNLERDLARAKSRVIKSHKDDIDKATKAARDIKKEALGRFDADMAEAKKIKQQAAERFEADLQAARSKVKSLESVVHRELQKGEREIRHISDGNKVKKVTKSTPKNISLAALATPSGQELKNLTELSERIKFSELSDQSIPLQELPERPETLFYLGDPFFGSGPISSGFEIFTGAVWQPQFIPFGTFSTAIQTSDDGNQQVSEWVNALDIYFNLNLTPTERLIVGFTPLDENGKFSGYQIYPNAEGVNGLNGHVQTLFFEGRFDSLFPGLKNATGNWASFDFSIGRQPVIYQSGILLNDTIDALGITRTSLYALGASEATLTGLYGWNNINRANEVNDDNTQLLGFFSTFNYPEHLIEADMVLVYGSGNGISDSLNFALSSYQNLWGLINTTFSYNQSVALGPNSLTPGTNNVMVGTGALFLSQLNMQMPKTIDNVYVNLFIAINDFTSAARGPDAGGPLGEAGLLFAATGLGNFGPALPNDGQKMFGGSVGYEHFLDSIRRRIIFEFGGVTRDATLAFGTQFEQAIGRNFFITLGSHVSYQQNHQRSFGYGLRSVFTAEF